MLKPQQYDCRNDKCRCHGDNVKGTVNNPCHDRFSDQLHFLASRTEITATNGCVRCAVERKHQFPTMALDRKL
jgi:hypothetical protein